MNPPHYIRKYVSSDHVKTGDHPLSMTEKVFPGSAELTTGIF